MEIWSPLCATVELVVLSTLLSAILGIPAAWAAVVLESKGQVFGKISTLFLVILVASISIPLILHAAAWEAAAGKFGWLPLTQTETRRFGFFSGLWASAWIHGIYGIPIVTLATWHGTRDIDPAILRAAALDQAPKHVWWRIQLPLAWPWITCALTASAALAVTEMTVVDLYGWKTIADEFYLFFAANPTTQSIAVTITTAAFPVCLLIVVLLRSIDKTNEHNATVHLTPAKNQSGVVETFDQRARLPMAIVIGTGTLVFGLPIFSIFLKAGHGTEIVDGRVQATWSFVRTFESVTHAPFTFRAEYTWTVTLAVVTGFLSMLLGWLFACLANQSSKLRITFDGFSLLLFFIPGPIIGLLVVSLFQHGNTAVRFLYESTIAAIVVALLVRGVSIAYWIVRSGYENIGEEIQLAAKLDGGVIRRVWFIDRRMLHKTLFIAMLSSGIYASGDVPVTLPVSPPGISTVGTRLFGLLHSGARQQEAALASWQVIGIVVVVFVAIGMERIIRVKKQIRQT